MPILPAPDPLEDDLEVPPDSEGDRPFDPFLGFQRVGLAHREAYAPGRPARLPNGSGVHAGALAPNWWL